MKIISYAFDDHANLMYNNTQAMRAAGLEASCFKLRSHPFGYSRQAPVVSRQRLKDLLDKADVIMGFHSFNFYLGDFTRQKKIIWHTGTSYRQNVKECNELFNPTVDMTITDQCEFMHLGAKNIHYMAAAIDTDRIKPMNKDFKAPYKIGHYPSNPLTKGTDKICEMMDKLKQKYPDNFIFDCNTTILPHEQNLKRIGSCDIYIELFSPMQGDKEYGCYGVTAFEAAAMNVWCVTQCGYPEVYANAYIPDLRSCHFPFLFVSNEDDFLRCIPNALTFCRNLLCQPIIEERHSLKATGDRMKKLIEQL